MLLRRRALTHGECGHSSRVAQQRLIALDEFVKAGCIALYAPFQNETDTTAILEQAVETGKRVLYPAVCGENMVFRLVERLEHLTTGTFGILEPCATGTDHLADEPDLIIVPGVVFDLSGHRIGYGKGYYDRFLDHPGLKADLVGLCHDFQVIDRHLPADAHDVSLDIIVTEKRVIHCGSNRRHHDGPDFI